MHPDDRRAPTAEEIREALEANPPEWIRELRRKAKGLDCDPMNEKLAGAAYQKFTAVMGLTAPTWDQLVNSSIGQKEARAWRAVVQEVARHVNNAWLDGFKKVSRDMADVEQPAPVAIKAEPLSTLPGPGRDQ